MRWRDSLFHPPSPYTPTKKGKLACVMSPPCAVSVCVGCARHGGAAAPVPHGARTSGRGSHPPVPAPLGGPSGGPPRSVPCPAPGSRAADGPRSGRAPARRWTHDWSRALVPPSPRGSRVEFKSGLSRLTAMRLFIPDNSARPRLSRLEFSFFP